jgi:precorrin-6x reductase
MTQQTKALRLADWLETLRLSHDDHPMNCLLVAAELRRLHAVNAQLLEALNMLAAWNDGEIGSHMDAPYAAEVARAAIKAAKENQ